MTSLSHPPPLLAEELQEIGHLAGQVVVLFYDHLHVPELVRFSGATLLGRAEQRVLFVLIRVDYGPLLELLPLPSSCTAH